LLTVALAVWAALRLSGGLEDLGDDGLLGL
jgi:hypothetical protein